MNELQAANDWHARDVTAVEGALDANAGGLTASEASARLAKYGANELPHAPPPTWWQIGLRQFHSPLIYILGIAAAVSVAIGEPTDAGFIPQFLGSMQ